MSTKQTEATFMDSVNDRIDLILDEPLKAVGHVLFPIICVGLVFGANALGIFNSLFPNAGWGLLTMMGLGLYSALMVTKSFLIAADGGPTGDWEWSARNPF